MAPDKKSLLMWQIARSPFLGGSALPTSLRTHPDAQDLDLGHIRRYLKPLYRSCTLLGENRLADR